VGRKRRQEAGREEKGGVPLRGKSGLLARWEQSESTEAQVGKRAVSRLVGAEARAIRALCEREALRELALLSTPSLASTGSALPQRTASSRRGKRSPLRAAARAAPARGARRAQLPKSRSPVVAGSAGLTKKYKKGLRARRGCNARAGRARGKCKRHLQPAAKSSAKHAAWQRCRLAMPAFQKR